LEVRGTGPLRREYDGLDGRQWAVWWAPSIAELGGEVEEVEWHCGGHVDDLGEVCGADECESKYWLFWVLSSVSVC
jgi:hypothetical protein